MNNNEIKKITLEIECLLRKEQVKNSSQKTVLLLSKLYTDKNYLLLKIIQNHPMIKDILIAYYHTINKFNNEDEINACLQFQIENLVKTFNWILLLQGELQTIKNMKNNITKNKLVDSIKNTGNEYQLIFMSQEYENLKNNLIEIEILERQSEIIKDEIRCVISSFLPFPK